MIKEKKEYIIIAIAVFLILGTCIFYSNSNKGQTKKVNDVVNEKNVKATEKVSLENKNVSSSSKSETINQSQVTTNEDKKDNTAKSGTVTQNSNTTKNEVTAKPIEAPAVAKPTLSNFEAVAINFEEYTVKQGDTLSNIWRNNIICLPFSKAKASICHENQLESEEDLKPGQKLKIPVANSGDYIKHKVSKGESLSSIAQKYNSKSGIDVKKYIEAIEKINGKENVTNIELQQIILVPNL